MSRFGFTKKWLINAVNSMGVSKKFEILTTHEKRKTVDNMVLFTGICEDIIIVI